MTKTKRLVVDMPAELKDEFAAWCERQKPRRFKMTPVIVEFIRGLIGGSDE